MRVSRFQPPSDEDAASIGGLLIDPATPGGVAGDTQPLGFVDLADCTAERWAAPLPPFPVVGIGARQHPLAATLDAIVEPPASAQTLVRQIDRAPRAAAVAVQLLRSLEDMAPERALPLESLGYGLLQGGAEHAAWLHARPSEPPSQTGGLRVARRGAVLRLVLDRPWARNAIDRSLRDALFEAFSLAAVDLEIERIELSALGPAFSIGGDLAEFGVTRDPAAAHMIRSRTLPALALARRLGILHAHVQGACVGAGIELAAFAERLTAQPDAWFQLPELAMGLIPGAGGCVSIPRRIGRQRTALMILSGRRISAARALSWGLIDAIEDRPAVHEGGADLD